MLALTPVRLSPFAHSRRVRSLSPCRMALEDAEGLSPSTSGRPSSWRNPTVYLSRLQSGEPAAACPPPLVRRRSPAIQPASDGAPPLPPGRRRQGPRTGGALGQALAAPAARALGRLWRRGWLRRAHGAGRRPRAGGARRLGADELADYGAGPADSNQQPPHPASPHLQECAPPPTCQHYSSGIFPRQAQ